MLARIVLMSLLLIVGCASSRPLTPENMQRVQLGMTAPEVTALIGAPRYMSPYIVPLAENPGALKSREMWTYAEASWPGTVRQAMVVFEDGRVVQVTGLGVARSTGASALPTPATP